MSRNTKAALAALAPLTPEQLTLMHHPSMGAAILQNGRSLHSGGRAPQNGQQQPHGGRSLSHSGGGAATPHVPQGPPPRPRTPVGSQPFSLFGGGGGGSGAASPRGSGLSAQASAPTPFQHEAYQQRGGFDSPASGGQPVNSSPVSGGRIQAAAAHRQHSSTYADGGASSGSGSFGDERGGGGGDFGASAGSPPSAASAETLLHGFGGILGGRDTSFGRAASFGFPTAAPLAPRGGYSGYGGGGGGEASSPGGQPSTPSLAVNGWRPVQHFAKAPGGGGGGGRGVDWSLAVASPPLGHVDHSRMLVGSL